MDVRGEGRDDEPFDELVGILVQDVAILESAGFALSRTSADSPLVFFGEPGGLLSNAELRSGSEGAWYSSPLSEGSELPAVLAISCLP